MGNQHENLIPPKPKYMTLLSHKTNYSKLKSITGLNASIYNNTIDYL